MSALERIRSMEHGTFQHTDERIALLMKAFKVMREIAIEVAHEKLNPHQMDESFWSKLESTVNEEFEKRMKKEKQSE